MLKNDEKGRVGLKIIFCLARNMSRDARRMYAFQNHIVINLLVQLESRDDPHQTHRRSSHWQRVDNEQRRR